MQEPVKQEFECHSCGSMYQVVWDPDEVELNKKHAPGLCPFCGADVVEIAQLDVDNVSETGYLGGEAVDHAAFGKGVDWMDGEE